MLCALGRNCVKIHFLAYTVVPSLSSTDFGSTPIDIRFCEKPVDSRLTLLKVSEIFTTVTNTPGAAETVRSILVVDDDKMLRDAMEIVLKLENYRVTTASNGRSALEAATSDQYSLIILDTEMPVMTGHEFLAAYARTPGPHSPIIICSGTSYEMNRSLPTFVVTELSKPFEIPELLALVRRYAQPT